VSRRPLRNLDEAIARVDRILDDVQAGRTPASEELWAELGKVIDVLERQVTNVFQRVPPRYARTAAKADQVLNDFFPKALMTTLLGDDV